MPHEATVQLAWLTESRVTKDGIQYLVLNVNMAIRSMEIHILTVNMSVYMFINSLKVPMEPVKKFS